MPEILVVGSVAYDSVKTPFGTAREILGGSATYFSVAASFFTRVSLVACVGHDFRSEDLLFLESRGIDLAGLEHHSGETFRWSGEYGQDMNTAQTLETHLNVFADFRPTIPEAYREVDFIFLGNIDPTLQRSVLSQVNRPKLVACDTMNFWIDGKPKELRETLRNVHVLLINDAETRELSGEWNLVKAARAVREMGPRTLVVKKGEHGVMIFTGEGTFAAPAFPLENVFDPTGAGDTFAGGFLGYLASTSEQGDAALRRAIVMGSALASFCCEAFSLDRLLTLTRPEIEERYRQFQDLTRFESL